MIIANFMPDCTARIKHGQKFIVEVYNGNGRDIIVWNFDKECDKTSSSVAQAKPVDDCDELKVLNLALLQPPAVNLPILKMTIIKPVYQIQ